MTNRAGIRARRITVPILGVIMVVVATIAPFGSAATADPGSQYVPWSDCLWGSDEPPTAVVDVYTHPYRITLNCGTVGSYGVRHIKDGHGFNNYTETCIAGGLRYGRRTPSNSNSLTWRYVYEEDKRGLESYDLYVFVSKTSDRVVSAYVDANDGESDSWAHCWAKFK